LDACTHSEAVRVEPLDVICERLQIEKVHFVKIDAERAELGVLEVLSFLLALLVQKYRY
jgi:FkbM family methyltransferase